MISDAANIVGLEQHVLRYWEDELQLEVPRNEMGHRFYTEDNIKEFLKIKELKEKGYQLKAIRMYLKSERQRNERNKATASSILTMTKTVDVEEKKEMSSATVEQNPREIKLEQFQNLMTEIVAAALKQNNADLSGEIGDRILKEMNYLIHEQQELQEERYIKLDAAIRGKRSPKEKRKDRKSFRKKREMHEQNIYVEQF